MFTFRRGRFHLVPVMLLLPLLYTENSCFISSPDNLKHLEVTVIKIVLCVTPGRLSPEKANYANSPKFNFPLLCLPFLSFPLRSLSLTNPFHFPFPFTPNPASYIRKHCISSLSVAPGPQTNFNAYDSQNAPRGLWQHLSVVYVQCK